MGPSKQMLEWPPEDQDETDRIQLLGQLAFDLTARLLVQHEQKQGQQWCRDMSSNLRVQLVEMDGVAFT